MTIETVKRMWPVAKHLTFIATLAAVWVAIAAANEGILLNIVIVLGSMHLGTVMLKRWPTTN